YPAVSRHAASEGLVRLSQVQENVFTVGIVRAVDLVEAAIVEGILKRSHLLKRKRTLPEDVNDDFGRVDHYDDPFGSQIWLTTIWTVPCNTNTLTRVAA